jgi:hypothetical protein
MWGSTPILNPEQIEELSSMVHGILEENKKKLEDALSESVEIESTSVLGMRFWTLSPLPPRRRGVE